MIINPVFITGAPRSGTSMLFHILRTSQELWSLPSEGFHIWNTLCHPSLRNWSSEEYPDLQSVTEREVLHIRKMYEQQSMPAWFWKKMGEPAHIWRFNRTTAGKLIRQLQGNMYMGAAATLYYLNPARKYIKRRIVDKSLNNCLRLELVNKIFPEARFIYLQRHGLSSIKSLINGWLNPDRFVTFIPPDPVKLIGYTGTNWKFVMPEGWREYNGRHLAELCTWQWRVCHEKILAFKKKYPDKFMDIKMEDLVSNSGPVLENLASHINVPFDNFSSFLKEKLPRINKTPDYMHDDFPFPEYLPSIKKEIAPIMELLGYE